MENVAHFKAAIAAIIAILTALWGWFGWLVVLFIFCMVVDFLTGSAVACRTRKWASSAARDGIWHKCGSIVVIIVAGVADLLIGTLIGHIPGVTLPFEYTVLLCPMVVVWYTLTELGSIVENAVALGAPVPAWLTKMLDAAKDVVDKAGDIAGGDNEHQV